MEPTVEAVKEGVNNAVRVGCEMIEALIYCFLAKLPVLISGESGVGKSEIARATANVLEIGFVVLDLSLLEPSDLIGLPVKKNGVTTYAPPAILPQGGRGILVLEELNRCEPYMRALALLLLTDRTLHQYELPPGWVVFACANPDNGKYQVSELDPALLARFLQLEAIPDRGEWLLYAAANDIHPAIVAVVELHEHVFDTIPPRTWTYVSTVLKAIETGFPLVTSVTGRPFDKQTVVRRLLSGYLPAPWVEAVCTELAKRAPRALDAEDIVRAYHVDEDLRLALTEARDSGLSDRLERVTEQVEGVVADGGLPGRLADGGFDMQAFEALLTDLPGDLRERLQRAFGCNPQASAIVGFGPETVLERYGRGGVATVLSDIAATPSLRHRLWAVATAVHAYIERLDEAEVEALRRNRDARRGLATLIIQLGPTDSGALANTLERLEIEPQFTRAERRRRRRG